jgi:hypothetical protein
MAVNSDFVRATRVRELHVTARGALAKGKEPSIGTGTYVPSKIVINTSLQTVPAFTVEDQNGNVLFSIDQTGGIATGPTPSTGLVSDGVAHAIYNFAVDGGASCTPAVNATIPANAIITGATINSVTAVTATGSATVAIGTSAGSSASSILTATGKASLSLDALVNGTVTLAAPVKLSAAGQVAIAVASGPLTAGVIEIFVYYVVAANS